MTELNPRFAALREMAEAFRLQVDPDNENLCLHIDQIERAVNEYYSQLQSWKEHVGCPDGIDHFKTAALTAHYLLKYPCLTLADPQNMTAIYRLANVVYVSDVMLSRLVDAGRPVLMGRQMKSRFLGILVEHYNALQRQKNASPEVLHDLAHLFIRVVSQILQDIENAHHSLDELPM